MKGVLCAGKNGGSVEERAKKMHVRAKRENRAHAFCKALISLYIDKHPVTYSVKLHCGFSTGLASLHNLAKCFAHVQLPEA